MTAQTKRWIGKRNEIWLLIVIGALSLAATGCGPDQKQGRRAGFIDPQGRATQEQMVGLWKAIESPQIRYTQQPILGHYVVIGETWTDFVSIYHRLESQFQAFDGLDLDGWGSYSIENGQANLIFFGSRTNLSSFYDFNRNYTLAIRPNGNRIEFNLDGFNYVLQRMNEAEIQSVFGQPYTYDNYEQLLNDLEEHWDLF